MDVKQKPQALAGAGADDKQQDCNTICDASISEAAKFAQLFEDSRNFIPPDFTEVLNGLNERIRAYCAIVYPDSMNPDMLAILQSGHFRGCLSPLHDKDYFPDGTRKKEHFHLVLYFDGKTSFSKAKAIFEDIFNAVGVQAVGNIVGAVRYLAHLDIQPDKVPSDKGKVRYSPDDIFSFGGFDAQSYVRATKSQIAEALGELYAIIREEDFRSYDLLVDYIYTERIEYTYIMANPHVCAQIKSYVCSRYARLHREDEFDIMKSQHADLMCECTTLRDILNAEKDILRDIISKHVIDEQTQVNLDNKEGSE